MLLSPILCTPPHSVHSTASLFLYQQHHVLRACTSRNAHRRVPMLPLCSCMQQVPSFVCGLHYQHSAGLWAMLRPLRAMPGQGAVWPARMGCGRSRRPACPRARASPTGVHAWRPRPARRPAAGAEQARALRKPGSGGHQGGSSGGPGRGGMARGESPHGGKRARPAQLPAPARPVALAGAAGQPDGGPPGDPGGLGAPGGLQAAAQSQAARSRRAAVRLERTPAPIPWINIAYQVLRDAQPKRFLTVEGIAECAARHGARSWLCCGCPFAAHQQVGSMLSEHQYCSQWVLDVQFAPWLCIHYLVDTTFVGMWQVDGRNGSAGQQQQKSFLPVLRAAFSGTCAWRHWNVRHHLLHFRRFLRQVWPVICHSHCIRCAISHVHVPSKQPFIALTAGSIPEYTSMPDDEPMLCPSCSKQTTSRACCPCHTRICPDSP